MYRKVYCILGEKAAKKINLIPLSSKAVSSRINNLVNNVKSELLKKIKLNYFVIQLGESTYVANIAVLLVSFKYIFKNFIQEHILFAKPLKTCTTREVIFDRVILLFIYLF